MKLHHLLFIVLLQLLIACDNASLAVDNTSRLNEIDAVFNSGRYRLALEQLTDYRKDHPKSYRALSLTGWGYVKLDDLDQANDYFDQSLLLNPKWDNAYTGKGVIYRKQGNLPAAREAYAEAIRLYPKNAEAYSSLLVIDILEKDFASAANNGEKSWELRQDLASIPANLAIAYHYLENEEKKWFFYEKAKALNYHRLQSVDDIFDGTLVIE